MLSTIFIALWLSISQPALQDLIQVRSAMYNHYLPHKDAAALSLSVLEASNTLGIGVPPDILLSVIETESNYNKTAVSKAGCVGLTQLNPKTAKLVNNTIKTKTYGSIKRFNKEITDVRTNVLLGALYLKILFDRYGRWDWALAAYNQGPGRFDRRHKQGIRYRYADKIIEKSILLRGLIKARE